MQTLKDSLKTIALSLSMLFFVGVAYAWTEPTDMPPNPAGGLIPLNTSSTFQDKVGDLWVSSLGLTNGLIVTGGDVGIGTTTPRTRLEVQAPTGITEEFNTAFRGTSNDGTKYINLNIQNDGKANFGGNFYGFGIGTTDPKEQLHITGSMALGNDVNGEKFIIHPRPNGNGDFLQITHDIPSGQSPYYAWDKGITLRRGGNVGIGTTSPGATLDVNGDIIVRSGDQSLDSSIYCSAQGALRTYNNRLYYCSSGIWNLIHMTPLSPF